MNKNRRSIYMIDKPFQYNMIAGFLFMIVFSLIIFSIGVGLYYWITYMSGDNIFKEIIMINKQVIEKEVESNGEGILGTDKRYVSKQFGPVPRWQIVLPPLIFNNVILMIAITVFGVFFSHRLAGPVYRMITDIRNARTDNKPAVIKLRKDDKFKVLADEINLLLEEYHQLKKK